MSDGQRVCRVSAEELATSGPDDGTGVLRIPGVSAATTGSQLLWMGLGELSPGHVTAVHHHGPSESALYVSSGHARWWFGEGLEESVTVGPGDFVFIPPEVVHLEENLSKTEPVRLIVARSSQESIVVNIEGHPAYGRFEGHQHELTL